MIAAFILIIAGNAHAVVEVELTIKNGLDSNGNIAVINGSNVKVSYKVNSDPNKILNKKDKILLLRVSDNTPVASVSRGKKNSGTVSLKVSNSEDEQLYVAYTFKGGGDLVARTSHPGDPGFIALFSIAKASTAGLTVELNALRDSLEARLADLENAESGTSVAALTGPTFDDDINNGHQVGTTWINTVSQQAYILVDSAPGSAIWKKITPVYEVGQRGPAGGIVIIAFSSGTEGYEASPEDLGTAEWGCFGTSITGADQTDIYSGSGNTADILAECNEAGIAAELADSYSLNSFDDWFLPSQDQLNELYLIQSFAGVFNSVLYWSSSESSANSGRVQAFNSGAQGNSNKNFAVGVRAVRSF